MGSFNYRLVCRMQSLSPEASPCHRGVALSPERRPCHRSVAGSILPLPPPLAQLFDITLPNATLAGSKVLRLEAYDFDIGKDDILGVVCRV